MEKLFHKINGVCPRAYTCHIVLESREKKVQIGKRCQQMKELLEVQWVTVMQRTSQRRLST